MVASTTPTDHRATMAGAGVFDIDIDDTDGVGMGVGGVMGAAGGLGGRGGLMSHPSDEDDDHEDMIEVPVDCSEPDMKELNQSLLKDPSVERLELSETTVGRVGSKAGPQDFELRKVLGKGGYGKVFQVRL